MDKRAILQSCKFGERVAEEESSELEKYFVETDQWARTYQGEVDVIYGPKGSGKSALYSLLIQRTNYLFDRGIIIVSAEKPRGTPAFKDIQQDPPTSEAEFVGLWKLYFLTLINSILQDYGADSKAAIKVNGYLMDAKLIEGSFDLTRMLGNVFNYVRSYFRPPQSIEGTIQIDPVTGQPKGVSGKISFTEPSGSASDIISVDFLLKEADNALENININLWILLDRLDVAFAETPDLEENALRALFRVYLDTMELNHVCPKIFLRTDIWKRISRGGFREASHITRHITIRWDTNSLINLVIRRALNNDAIIKVYNVDPEETLRSTDRQIELFYRLFPDKVDIGPNKSRTFEWILARTWDATKQAAPREIIHFLNEARDAQLRQYEVGGMEGDKEELFSRASLRDALPEVSKVRLNQTLYAEYPNLQKYVEAIRRDKTEQNPESLMRIWNLDKLTTIGIADQLEEVGFFEKRGKKAEPRYWVPFLYREALEMVQGKATELVQATGA
jgi:hypothetical protein